MSRYEVTVVLLVSIAMNYMGKVLHSVISQFSMPLIVFSISSSLCLCGLIFTVSAMFCFAKDSYISYKKMISNLKEMNDGGKSNRREIIEDFSHHTRFYKDVANISIVSFYIQFYISLFFI